MKLAIQQTINKMSSQLLSKMPGEIPFILGVIGEGGCVSNVLTLPLDSSGYLSIFTFYVYRPSQSQAIEDSSDDDIHETQDEKLKQEKQVLKNAAHKERDLFSSNRRGRISSSSSKKLCFEDCTLSDKAIERTAQSQEIDDVSSDSENGVNDEAGTYVSQMEYIEDTPSEENLEREDYNDIPHNTSNTLKGSEWLKNLKVVSNPLSNQGSPKSTQISTTSDCISEGGAGNSSNPLQDENRRIEIWDSSKKKRKTKKGGLVDNFEEIVKNESSDRILREHLKEKEGMIGMTLSKDSVTLRAKILNYEIGPDSLVRFRCCRDLSIDDCNKRGFPSVSSTFEVILNKGELTDVNFSTSLSKIELYQPFIKVQLKDYYCKEQNEVLTVITNPLKVKVESD